MGEVFLWPEPVPPSMRSGKCGSGSRLPHPGGHQRRVSASLPARERQRMVAKSALGHVLDRTRRSTLKEKDC